METLLAWLGRVGLKLLGWRLAGNPLPADKYVLACAYHTSNWDFAICMAARASVKAPVKWIGKHTLFHWPLGPIMRFLGGVPINRGLKTDMVGQIVEEFTKHKRFGVAIFPEGTRKRVSQLKTGFYYIAIKAGVPIQPGVLDYATKTFFFGPLLYPSGDYAKDLAILKTFFNTGEPKYPANADKDFSTQSPAPPTTLTGN